MRGSVFKRGRTWTAQVYLGRDAVTGRKRYRQLGGFGTKRAAGSIGGLGLLLAVLICPITMGAVMWFLMGSQRGAGTSPSDELTTEAPPANAMTAPRR